METVKIGEREFEEFLTKETIHTAIDNIATRMNKDLEGKNPLFICVLNGSFVFASELIQRISTQCEVSFVKMSSYAGTASTGNVKEIYGLQEDIAGRTVVIVEDIIDTGRTMVQMLQQLGEKNPKEIFVSTLLLKPDALEQPVQMDYIALEIPNDFIIGFGIDCDGYGRNLPSIYKLKE